MQAGNQPFQQGNAKSSGSKKLGCAFWLLPISAVILVGLSLWYTFTSYMFSTNGIEVEGTVVRLESSHSSEGGTTYSPVYRYTVDGEQYEYESVNSSSIPSHQVGESTTLLYDPNNPEKARVNSFWEMWLLPCIMCPVSFVMVLLSVGIPFLMRRRG
jgi:hypothetical protein